MAKKPTYEDLERHIQILENEASRFKESEITLRQSKERFKALFDQNPISIEIYDTDGTQREVNHAWQELFGIKPSDSVGKYNCLKDEQAVKIGSALAFKLVLKGRAISLPDSVFDPTTSGYPTGRKRRLRSNFFPIKDHEGNICNVVLMHEDITERVQMREKYKWLVEHSNEAIFVVHNDQVKFFNEQFATLTGYSPDSISQKKFHKLIHPDDRNKISIYHKKKHTDNKTLPLNQYRIITQSGGVKWLQTNGVAIDWEDKPSTLLFASDITELKNAEDQIKEHQAHLEELVVDRTRDLMRANRQLIEEVAERKKAQTELAVEKNKIEAILAAFGDALTVHDTDFRILYQNETHINIQGSHIGEYCYQAYHKRDTICDGCVLAKSFNDGKIHKRETTTESNGKTFYVEVTASPLKDASGKVVAGVEIVRDITETKNMAEQLMQSRKMEAIGTLAGGIAHDFNNILTSIIGYAELSMIERDEGSSYNDNLNEIVKAGKRAASLINQILTYSRKTDFERKTIQPQPIIKEAIKLLRGIIPTSINIKQNISPQSSIILGDITQLHQIMLNLCTNAYQAMHDQKGTIEVVMANKEFKHQKSHNKHAIPAGKYVHLSVADNGHGMDEKTMARIFDPYFTKKSPGEGTGLGLATVHGIVNQHNGYITVESTPGVGTTFHIFFPLHEEEPQKAEPENKKLPIANIKGNVLIVDDDPVIVDIAQKVLENIGCNVTSFLNSEEAFKRFCSGPDAFDLVITDQTMPKMTGYDMAQKILEIRPEIPIILVTGYSATVDKEKAQLAGIHEFMMKPYDIYKLIKNVARLLQKNTPQGIA